MKITTHKVTKPTQEIAIALGSLMPDLSDNYSSEQISLKILQKLSDDPQKALIVAKYKGEIVGCAVLNLIITLHKPKAWLEDFVVSSGTDIRGKGVGYAIWQEIVRWVEQQGATLEFTSSEKRVEAHRFYKKQGANIKDTCVFFFEPN